MKPLEKMAVALRECQRCGNLVVVRFGEQEEHTSRGEICHPSEGRRSTGRRGQAESGLRA